MMLTIHGLPISTKYHDLKVLVKQQCNISDYILDNLVSEGDGTKKVRIGVTNEREGEYVLKCLDGYRLPGSGCVLRVEPVGKTGNIMNAQPAPNPQRYAPIRNSYPNQASDYNHQIEHIAGRTDSWAHQSSTWSSNQAVPTQAHAPQPSYNYQQSGPGLNQPYGQQPVHHRPEARSYEQPHGFPPARAPPQDQRYGLAAKSTEPAAHRLEPRSHVLRSVEIVDEPMNRPLVQPNKYPGQGYDMPQKPITISKDNFQGPSQYIPDRPTQPHGQYQPPGLHQGHWEQQIPPEKSLQFNKPNPTQFDRKYPDPSSRQPMPTTMTNAPRNVHDSYGKPYEKGGHGPRFSPRRDLPKDGPGPRFSPRRDIPKDGSRFSPRRDIPKDGHGPRFSPRRDKDVLGPRFSPRRDKDVLGPQFSPRRDKDVPGPRFSPRRDKDGLGPRFSPRRDKDGPGPRFSPRRDKDVLGPRFSPRRDKGGPGPRFSPRRDKDILGPRFSPRRDKDGPGPRFSPQRDKVGTIRFSPRRDLSKVGPGPSFAPRRDIPKDMSGQRFSPRREVPLAPHGRRESPSGRRLSPGRGIPLPGDRRMPGRRESPAAHKRVSPGRRDSPSRSHIMRYSPGRRHPDKPAEKYGAVDAPRAASKEVRPAYEPPSQAPNQAIYAGGYRPIAHESIQYPIPGMRQPDRNAPWQQDRDKPMVPASMNRDEDRRDMRMPTFEPRLEANSDAPRSRSPVRKSRSPNRRDRYKKHSPSPRSPRRSWALEKRRSPDIRDAPPPPMWPGQNLGDHQPRTRANFPEITDDDKGGPVWERPPYEEKTVRRERQAVVEDRFSKQTPIRVRTDLTAPPSHALLRPPSPRGLVFKPDERYPPREPVFEPRQTDSKFDIRSRETKFEPRDREPKFEPREEFRRPDIDRKQYDRPDFRDGQRPMDKDDHSRRADRREEFARREERKEAPKTQSFNKEVEDVYKRAVEFNKKAQEFRKADDRGRDDYADDRGHREAGRHEPKDYDRQKFSRAGDRDEACRDFLHAAEETRRHEEPERRTRQPEWKVDDGSLSTLSGRAKREKAINEIADRIMNKHGSCVNPEWKTRISVELNLAVSRILKEMFGNQDVSFIEMVVKFNAKYETKDEMKLLQEVMSSFPRHCRNTKRPAEEPARVPEVPAKSARLSHEHHMSTDVPGTINETHRSRPLAPVRRSIPQYGPETKPARTTWAAKPILNAFGSELQKSKNAATKPQEKQQKAIKPLQKQIKVQPKLESPGLKAAEPKPQRAIPERKLVKPVPEAAKVVPTPALKEVQKVKSASNEAPSGGVAGAPPSVETQPGGRYELNPLMTRALEIELQQIMMKVWQELPDEPPSEAEKLVADKFRNETGDDLRNMLGLNVTKRLLNIHNSLLVKLSFSGKPEEVHLKRLVREYGCVAIRRGGGAGGGGAAGGDACSFVLRLGTVAGFDNICGQKVVQCGDVKATVTPCYDFRQCPTNLKSIYNEKTTKNTDIDKTTENADIQNETLECPSLDKKPAVTPDKKTGETPGKKTGETPGKKTEETTVKKASEIPEKKTAQIPAKKAAVMPDSKPSQRKVVETAAVSAKKPEIPPPAKKPVVCAPLKKTETTQAVPLQKKTEIPPSEKALTGGASPKKIEIPKTPVAAVAVSIEKKTEITATEKKPAGGAPLKKATETSQTEKQNETKTAGNKNTTGNTTEIKNVKTASDKSDKALIGKLTAVSNNTPKAVQNTTTVASPKPNPKIVPKQDPSKINAIKGSNVNKTKALNKNVKSVNDAKVTATKNKLKDMIVLDENTYDEEFDENDELSDDDILALMSGAIVLDECSGSGEE